MLFKSLFSLQLSSCSLVELTGLAHLLQSECMTELFLLLFILISLIHTVCKKPRLYLLFPTYMTRLTTELLVLWSETESHLFSSYCNAKYFKSLTKNAAHLTLRCYLSHQFQYFHQTDSFQKMVAKCQIDCLAF